MKKQKKISGGFKILGENNGEVKVFFNYNKNTYGNNMELDVL